MAGRNEKMPAGTVFFRGSLPARPEAYSFLEKRGIKLAAVSDQLSGGWVVNMEHSSWGRAKLFIWREPPLPPREIVDHEPYLLPEERADILAARSAVTVEMETAGDSPMRERKKLLHYLQAVSGGECLAAADHLAQKWWTPFALAEETAHDAELDIEGLFGIHAVSDDGKRVEWLHTHGLGNIGLLDFDILEPSDDLTGRGGSGGDLLRCIACAILEGKARSESVFSLARPGGDVSFVDAQSFTRRASRRNAHELRDGKCEDHMLRRVVVCDPPGGFFARLLGRSRPAPSSFLSGEIPDELLLHFTTEAGKMMARRAQDTYQVFRKLVNETAELELPALVKAGYRTAEGGEDDLEHLWFKVEAAHDFEVEATLTNTPFNVPELTNGQRVKVPVARLTDWAILSPAGTLNPRETWALRWLRANREKLAAALAEHRREQGKV